MSIRSKMATSSGACLMVTSGMRVPVRNTSAPFTNTGNPQASVSSRLARSASCRELRR